MMAQSGKVGLWLIGAKGGIATCVSVGWAMLTRSLTSKVGLVTELPQFAQAGLVDWPDIVIGGHEIRDVSLAEESRAFASVNRTFERQHVDLIADALESIEQQIRYGTVFGADQMIAQLASPNVPRDRSAREAIERIAADLKDFKSRHNLRSLIVINVASTEPPVDPSQFPAKWSELEQLLAEQPDPGLPTSTLYAIAAFETGCPYINFTPSLGPALPALDELAQHNNVPYMGCDGKTGETLMKSVLAPMFRARNLRVLSWVGHNIFGNLDGKILDDPRHKSSKVQSKDRVVSGVLGYHPQTLVSIEYIEGLGDWKTAWDHVHFQGFLGVPMVLQFIWQGCDSILAAPLVLDLCRLTERAHRIGIVGLMPFLASFFKSPYDVKEADFFKQFQMLEQWIESVSHSHPS
ncbi:MAG TPA: inositol-3-phosphate synthase [Thermogutta sp.]|nr:inositol-3-phosphate synthase [Thermogutta sp.]HPU06955.1 inositol-3-phosphate synthase [Thermogutta sp.]HQF12483.1 inositol-3-phosphate synthase [Thermogutta sp.]